MDGRGRALDNVFVERLWRNVKQEDLYLKGYETAVEMMRGFAEYFQFYNTGRPHQSLGDKNPGRGIRKRHRKRSTHRRQVLSEECLRRVVGDYRAATGSGINNRRVATLNSILFCLVDRVHFSMKSGNIAKLIL